MDWAEEDHLSDDEDYTRERQWLMEQDDRQEPECLHRQWIENSILFTARDG